MQSTSVVIGLLFGCIIAAGTGYFSKASIDLVMLNCMPCRYPFIILIDSRLLLFPLSGSTHSNSRYTGHSYCRMSQANANLSLANLLVGH